MINAYLDESGIHEGAPACVVAGYFGGRGKWKKFESDWRALLQHFNVPLDKFHSKNFYPFCKPGTFFNDWDKTRHAEFLKAITYTIASNEKIHPVAMGVINDDFFSFDEPLRRFFTGADVTKKKAWTFGGSPNKPYFVSFQHCVVRICEYTEKGGKANFFFGLDRTFSGYATALFEQIRLSKLRSSQFGWDWKDRLGNSYFPRAAATPELQIADFFANLTYHHMIKAGESISSFPPSELIEACIKNCRSRGDDFLLFNKEVLEGQIEQAMATTALRQKLSI